MQDHDGFKYDASAIHRPCTKDEIRIWLQKGEIYRAISRLEEDRLTQLVQDAVDRAIDFYRKWQIAQTEKS